MTRRTLESESSVPRLFRRARRLALAASVGLALLSGCGSPDGAPADDEKEASAKPGTHKTTATDGSGANAVTTQTASGSAPTGFGTVGFDLQLSSATVDTGSYEIQGNNFDASGPIDLSNAPNVSVLVGGIPFGTGYQATLKASSSKLVVLDCTGTATFDVTGTDMSTVTVPMDCKESALVPVPPAASMAFAVLVAASGIMVLRGAGRSRRRVA